MTEVADVSGVDAPETPKKRGRPKLDGDYLSTTIRIPTALAKDVKRIAFVLGSTQEKEITQAIQDRVAAQKSSEDYKAKLNALLAE